MKAVFIIGAVWVEPKSSAAGSRMLQLIEFFQLSGWTVFFGTAAQRTPNSLDLSLLGVTTVNVVLNDASFDNLLLTLNPTIVVFDRYITEEQYGWRVAEILPKALRVLDTEDLHCLRKVREKKYKLKKKFQRQDLLVADIFKREIAAIFRSDLSLIISLFEMNLLQETFGISKTLLFYLPFLIDDEQPLKELPNYDSRKHFVSIGNFLHSPNLASVSVLKKEIWGQIRKQIPKAELHVYGAYPTQEVLAYTNLDDGFFVHGFVENLDAVLQDARVLLAPLAFGAGLKGKFIDAMANGCPSVTTSIGIEGYANAKDWAGYVADDWRDFANRAINLYQQKDKWQDFKSKGFELLHLFKKANFYGAFIQKIEELTTNLETHRKQNFLGSILHHHTLKSTKYLSKWIEEKNKNI